ncbi:MAG: von Willebrand factor type A domain-containing protein, partial [Gemmataceae bacterium]
MHDEHNPDLEGNALPDDMQRAVELVRHSPLPEEARQRAREKAVALDSGPATRPLRPSSSSGRRLGLVVGLTAAAAIMAAVSLSMIGSNATSTFNSVGDAINQTPTGKLHLETGERRVALYDDGLSRVEEVTVDPSAPQQDSNIAVNTIVPGPVPMKGPHPGLVVGGEGQQPPFANPAAPDEPHNTEAYDRIVDNAFRLVSRDPLSTFSVDVDTASYSNLRRFLNDGQLPPKDAVRIEEMINYFKYDYPDPKGEAPVSINTELTDCPWKPAHRLLRIGLQGKRIDPQQLPARNLVFLLDVSGSMSASNKLPLVKQSMK